MNQYEKWAYYDTLDESVLLEKAAALGLKPTGLKKDVLIDLIIGVEYGPFDLSNSIWRQTVKSIFGRGVLGDEELLLNADDS